MVDAVRPVPGHRPAGPVRQPVDRLRQHLRNVAAPVARAIAGAGRRQRPGLVRRDADGIVYRPAGRRHRAPAGAAAPADGRPPRAAARFQPAAGRHPGRLRPAAARAAAAARGPARTDRGGGRPPGGPDPVHPGRGPARGRHRALAAVAGTVAAAQPRKGFRGNGHGLLRHVRSVAALVRGATRRGHRQPPAPGRRARPLPVARRGGSAARYFTWRAGRLC